ncbi:MAG: DNA primase small subunit domain-containing protein [Candidatus ainarchaeum sp.]|nr:DNA primase small subunit domain-containing protein [Candidatus ainarchaeum sp.]
MQEQDFLKKHFSGFYKANFVEDPPEPGQREFGIGEFGRKITQRHLSFSSLSEFNSFLQKETPFFVSYSTALYNQPSARPMEAKGFLEGDIVYEFDADDIKTPCKQIHDSWACPKCNAKGKGAIELCTECGTPVKVEQWFCEECLGEAKKQIFELKEFLEEDFSFTEGISINFSGSAGFHLHLRGKNIRQLPQAARIELLDFLTGTNLDLEAIGFLESGKALECPKQGAFGWPKKIMLGLKELIENAPSDKIAAIAGVRDSNAKKFLEKKQKILEGFEKGMLFPFPTKKSREFWLALVKFVVEQKRLDIDRQTSIDLNKIIRVPNTIHGGTGFVAKKISWEELKKFNAFNDALAFSEEGTAKVLINKAPRFNIGGKFFGPFQNSEAELPLNAAVFLVAKQAARLVG